MFDVPSTARNPLAEALLDELGLEWELVMLPRDQIDHDKSLKNQARIEPIHELLVERYVEARRHGAVFPAILVGFNGSKRGKTADGNHRVESGDRAGVVEHAAYRFSFSSDEEFRAVADLANARLNGAESTLEERLMHAADHVANGVPRDRAAALFGVGKSALSTFMVAQKARQRFAALNIGARAHMDLSDSVVVQINGVATDQAVGAALKAIRDGQPVKHVVRVLRDAASAAVTEDEKARAQLDALRLLASPEVSAADLAAPGKQKKDTTRMRLIGCIKAIEDATANPRPEFAPIFARIREALDRV